MRAAVLRRSAMLRWKHHSKNWTVKGGISETRGSLWAKPVPSRRAWKKKKKNKRQNAAPFPANERAPWTAGPACSPRTAPQLRAARPPPAGSTDRAPRGKGGASPARTAAEPRPTLGSPAPPRPHLSGFRRRGAASAARLLPRLLPERRGRRRLLRREAAAPSRCCQQPPLGAPPRRGPAPARRRHVVPRGGRARTLTLAGACAQDQPEAGRPPSQQEGRDRTAGPCRPWRSRPLKSAGRSARPLGQRPRRPAPPHARGMAGPAEAAEARLLGGAVPRHDPRHQRTPRCTDTALLTYWFYWTSDM